MVENIVSVPYRGSLYSNEGERYEKKTNKGFRPLSGFFIF